METTQEIVDRLRAYKEKFADKYGIEQLGLFGSVARGEQDEKSDIDVFITMSRPSFFTRMNIKEELQKLFHRKVDLITLHENMFRSFRQNLERDAIYIWNECVGANGVPHDESETGCGAGLFSLSFPHLPYLLKSL